MEEGATAVEDQEVIYHGMILFLHVISLTELKQQRLENDLQGAAECVSEEESAKKQCFSAMTVMKSLHSAQSHASVNFIPIHCDLI